MKKYGIILIICFSFILGSCNNSDTNGDYTSDNEKQIKESDDIDFGDTSYNIETDSQNYFDSVSKSYAATTNGYYTFDDTILYFIDKTTCDKFPVCSRTDCSHDNADCDAYFNEHFTQINYYEGSLYTIQTESDESSASYWLYKISLDGSVREKVFDMYSTVSRGSVPTYIIHRGYVYYRYEDGEECHLVKSRLDGSNQQEIFSTASESGIWNISGYGDGILFYIVSDISMPFEGRILYYSQTGDELYKIAENAYYLFAASEDSIIYTDGKDILKTGIDDLSTEVFVKGVGGMLTCSYDGKYIYVDNVLELWDFYDQENCDYSNRKIDVYSRDGGLVDTIELPGQQSSADFGDADYMFFSFYENRKYMTRIFDKSQIGTGSYEWLELQ